MTQHRKATRSHLHFPQHRTGKLAPARSLLRYGFAWMGAIGLLGVGDAWAQTAPGAVPSAQELLEAPAPEPPAAIPAPEPAAPEPEPVAPAAVRPPDAVVESAPPAPPPIPQPAAASPEAPRSADAYIDSTDYSIGATKPSQAPSSVIVTERSTGCQVVLQQGQGVPAAMCAAPSRPKPSAVAARSSRSQMAAQGGSVNVGPLRVSASGVGVGAMPSVRDFYNRTIRPTGRLGNGNISAIFPLSIPAAITSAFGWRIHPISGDRRFHQGTDLGAPLGTPVLAAYSGQVSIADFLRGYGLTVVLKHHEGQNKQQPPTAETLYAHLSELFVQPGDWVEQGDVIGRVGSTGNSTGPHLHFEFRQLTPAGWQALDAGQMLEAALVHLTQSVQIGRLIPLPAPPDVPPIAPQPEPTDPIEALRQWQQRNQDRNA